jgi:hypothetical protein
MKTAGQLQSGFSIDSWSVFLEKRVHQGFIGFRTARRTGCVGSKAIPPKCAHVSLVRTIARVGLLDSKHQLFVCNRRGVRLSLHRKRE